MKILFLVCSLPLALAAIAAGVPCRPFAAGDVRLDGDGPFMTAYETNRRYLMEELDPARFLSEFRKVAGLPRKADRYGGWESDSARGHTLGHYLSALSYLYAQTKDRDVKRRVDYIVEELFECQLAHGDGYVSTTPKERVWDRVRSGAFDVSEFDLCRVNRPIYILDKTMAGLRDAYRAAGNARALEVERKLADWYLATVKGLDDGNLQKLLSTDWGSLNEVLSDLADDTGDARYREAARTKFFERRLLEPLAKGDAGCLDGRQAAIQAAKMPGCAALARASGDATLTKAVDVFWKSVVGQRTFVTGACGWDERFTPVRQITAKLGPHNGETCVSAHLIRLAGRLFAREPSRDKMDYVERVMINHQLSQIGRQPGEYGYFQSLSPVAEKVFSSGRHTWWCCIGYGLEAPLRWAQQAYSHTEDTLWVNLYLGSRVIWRKKGFAMKTKTRFPEEDSVTYTIVTLRPTLLGLRFRIPSWCAAPAFSLNDKSIVVRAGKDGYGEIRRVWQRGDSVTVHLPMTPRTEELSGSGGRFVAFLKGPQVMAGLTAPEFGLEDHARHRHSDQWRAPGGTAEPARAVRATSGRLSPPKGMKFAPLWKLYEQHYTVYFPVCDAAEFAKREAERATREKELAARKASVVDQVVCGWWRDEEAHRWNGAHDTTGSHRGRSFRHAPGESGRFMYELAVDPRAQQYVEATYNGDDNGRVFELCVDWKVIATVELKRQKPGQFFTERYPIPKELTAGKDRVTVCFRGKKGTSWTGAVFHIAIVK